MTILNHFSPIDLVLISPSAYTSQKFSQRCSVQHVPAVVIGRIVRSASQNSIAGGQALVSQYSRRISQHGSSSRRIRCPGSSDVSEMFDRGWHLLGSQSVMTLCEWQVCTNSDKMIAMVAVTRGVRPHRSPAVNTLLLICIVPSGGDWLILLSSLDGSLLFDTSVHRFACVISSVT